VANEKIMERIILLIFVVFPIMTYCQKLKDFNKMNSSEINEIFDKIILEDKIYPYEKTNFFPKGQYNFTKEEYKGVIQSLDDIWVNELKEHLDGYGLNDHQKIQFIKDCLTFQNRDIFANIEYRPIEFWKTNTEARTLIENYFLHQISSAPENVNTKLRFSSFKIKHNYPDSYELITNHFKNRSGVNHIELYDGDAIYYLSKLGYIEEAIAYLESMYSELLDGKIKYISFGYSFGHPDEFDDTTFDQLLKTENQTLRSKILNLLCKFIELGGKYNIYLSQTLKRYDFERYKSIRYEKFKNYSKIDFSKVIIEDIKKKEDLIKIIPESTEYFNELMNDGMNIGKFHGKEIWEEFIRTKKYWIFSGYGKNYPELYIMSHCLLDPKLSQTDKTEMFKNVNFTGQDLIGDYEKFMLKNIIKIIFPDLKIDETEFNTIGLGKIFTYTNPLNLDVQYFDKDAEKRFNFGAKEREEIMFDLNKIGLGLNFRKNKFSVNDLSFANSVLGTIFRYFRINDDLVWIDNESFKGNFVQIFKSNFAPILRKFELPNIEMSQVTNETPEGIVFNLYVKGKTQIFTHNYSDIHTDWFDPIRLVKLINLNLEADGEELRFVQVYTGDQTSAFILVIPSQILSVFQKYDIPFGAIKPGDMQ